MFCRAGAPQLQACQGQRQAEREKGVERRRLLFHFFMSYLGRWSKCCFIVTFFSASVSLVVTRFSRQRRSFLWPRERSEPVENWSDRLIFGCLCRGSNPSDALAFCVIKRVYPTTSSSSARPLFAFSGGIWRKFHRLLFNFFGALALVERMALLEVTARTCIAKLVKGA